VFEKPQSYVSPLAVGDEHYITGDGDLRYAILFENLDTATLPAQEVVVTDQLDVSTLDLDSFSVGSISFGTHSVVPPPGLSAFTADVDLPERNLVPSLQKCEPVPKLEAVSVHCQAAINRNGAVTLAAQ
jgi:hypothetical protein